MKKSIPTEWQAELPEVQEDELLSKALRQKFDAELRQRWAAQLEQEGVRRQPEAHIVAMRPRRVQWWAVAASALVLLGAAWWLFLKPAQSDSAPMAQQYFTEIAAQAAQTRMGEGEEEARWQAAKDHYAQGQFAAAADSMALISEAKPLSVEQRYFHALCLLQMEPPAYPRALNLLDEAAQFSNLSNKTDAYRAEIEWVRALALLKSGDASVAKVRLEEIARDGGWFAEKAKNLLNHAN